MSPADHRVRPVAILGTFDVRNYGDLLFPLLAEHRLGPHGYAIQAFSPSGARTGWHDAATCFPMSELISRIDCFAAFLVGGGNVIHKQPANLKEYSNKMDVWSYSSLWAGAAALGAIANRPVIWNAPGVQRAFSDADLTAIVRPAIQACDYVSVRDEQSRKLLGEAAGVTVVPDTAAEIARMWPKTSLRESQRRMRQRKGLEGTQRYAAIHVKQRSVERGTEGELAEAISQFSRRTGLLPLLLAIGPCHGDDRFARNLSSLIAAPHILVDDPNGLKEMASIIAHADAYVGCSLHGFITAAAYQVPARMVAIPALIKFRGFLSHLRRESDLVDHWPLALTMDQVSESTPSPIPDSVFCQLDDHWRRIVSILREPLKGGYVRRTRFLRHFVKNGLSAGGWDWASDGLVG